MTGTAILLAVFSMSGSCSKDAMTDMTGSGGNNGGSKVPGTDEVFIQYLVFNPATITIAVNTTIKRTNKDGFAHSSTSNTGQVSDLMGAHIFYDFEIQSHYALLN